MSDRLGLLGEGFASRIKDDPVGFAKIVLRRLDLITESLNLIDPDGTVMSPAQTPVAVVVGGVGPLVRPNTLGLGVGELVAILDGSMYRADYTTRPATHAVGSVLGANVLLYAGWAAGPVLLDGNGADDVIYLSTSGRGRLNLPPRSSGNTSYEQVLGHTLDSGTNGLVSAKLLISDAQRRR